MSTFNGIIAWNEGAKEMVENVLLRDADVYDADVFPAYDAETGMSDSVLQFSCEGDEDVFRLTVLRPLEPYVKSARIEMRGEEQGDSDADFVWDDRQKLWIRRELGDICNADDLLDKAERTYLRNLLRADGSDMARRTLCDLFRAHTSVVEFEDEGGEDSDWDEERTGKDAMDEYRRRKSTRALWTIVVLVVLIIFGAAGQSLRWSSLESTVESVASVMDTETATPTAAPTDAGTDAGTNAETAQAVPEDTWTSNAAFSLSDVPAYAGEPYVAVNNNIPYFSNNDLTTTSFEQYGDLDSLGRCQAAYASIGQDLMPTEKRSSISSVKPTGWHNAKYEGIDGKYLYNRCHLIGYQLTAENANEKNLITGTRYMNVEGMEPFENMTADYIKDSGNHVLYRVTPEFEGNNLVASGVLMEGKSVEDDGAGVQFCVYCYNVQPGITIDYATGESAEATG